MKKQLLLCLLSIFTINGMAQNYYYTNKSQKTYLQQIPNKKFLLLSKDITNESILKQRIGASVKNVEEIAKTNILSSINSTKSVQEIEKNWAIIECTAGSSYSNNSYVLYESPAFTLDNNVEATVSHLFYGS